jgi:hypothetical protein
MNNILKDYGFERETGGGGCVILSRYMLNEAFVWITCIDGGGLPDSDNWLVCAYGDDIEDIIYQASSESDLTLEQAADKACDIAIRFQSKFELCRNGVSYTDCDCC